MSVAERIGSIRTCAIRVQRALGRGLYEFPYREALAHDLRAAGCVVEREVPFSASYGALVFPRAFRADLVVDRSVMVELKAVTDLHPIHFAQARTYLRFSGCDALVLVNFWAPRIVDGFHQFHPPSPGSTASSGMRPPQAPEPVDATVIESSRKG